MPGRTSIHTTALLSPMQRRRSLYQGALDLLGSDWYLLRPGRKRIQPERIRIAVRS